MPPAKRALSEAEKQEREAQIIDAAHRLLIEKGFFYINMNHVAEAAGLAKGTVYIYFKTKEALFLSVFETESARWFEELAAGLATFSVPTEAETLTRYFVQAITTKPNLMRLFTMSPVVLEHNISFERIRAHKVWMMAGLQGLGLLVEKLLGLSAGEGLQLLLRIYVFITGLESLLKPSALTAQVYASEPGLPIPAYDAELYTLILMAIHAMQPKES